MTKNSFDWVLNLEVESWDWKAVSLSSYMASSWNDKQTGGPHGYRKLARDQ